MCVRLNCKCSRTQCPDSPATAVAAFVSDSCCKSGDCYHHTVIVGGAMIEKVLAVRVLSNAVIVFVLRMVSLTHDAIERQTTCGFSNSQLENSSSYRKLDYRRAKKSTRGDSWHFELCQANMNATPATTIAAAAPTRNVTPLPRHETHTALQARVHGTMGCKKHAPHTQYTTFMHTTPSCLRHADRQKRRGESHECISCIVLGSKYTKIRYDSGNDCRG